MPVEDAELPPDVREGPGAQNGPLGEATLTTPRDPSSTVLGLDEQDLVSHRGTEEDLSLQEDQEPLPEFDPKVRQDFEGLLYLGRLTHKYHYLGHEFVIRTITTGETLEIGLLHKPYADTMGDIKAYQAALAAACVVTVDGRPLPAPLTVDASDTALLNRFEYVLRSWFPTVIDMVYEQYLILEDRVRQVMEAMSLASR